MGADEMVTDEMLSDDENGGDSDTKCPENR